MYFAYLFIDFGIIWPILDTLWSNFGTREEMQKRKERAKGGPSTNGRKRREGRDGKTRKETKGKNEGKKEWAIAIKIKKKLNALPVCCQDKFPHFHILELFFISAGALREGGEVKFQNKAGISESAGGRNEKKENYQISEEYLVVGTENTTMKYRKNIW